MTTSHIKSSFIDFPSGRKIVFATIVSLVTLVGAGSCGSGCTSDADCDDGVFCNGIESCDTNTGSCVAISSCPPSIPPTVCNEETDTCDPAP